MSRIDVRIEDVLTLLVALAMLLFLGVKSFGTLHLSEQNYWDFAFILMPVALLVFMAAVRYAFRPVGASDLGRLSTETGSVFRDWSPFLIFLLMYESFRAATWAVVSPVGEDATLLALDYRLFGETGSVWFDPFVTRGLTSLMTLAYFLHLVLPPLIGLVWYRRDLRLFRHFLLAVLIAGMLGTQGYMLVPAIGPGLMYPALYKHLLTGDIYSNITGLMDTARAPRDVFPSLHVGISSIVLYFGWRRGRGMFACLLPLVVANWMSTLYLRYHYTVDVVAGWVVAIAAIWLADRALRLEARVKERFSASSATASART